MEAIDQTSTKLSHPLEYKWVWSYKPTIVYKVQTAEDWLADYRQVSPTPFGTVEEFWTLFSHMHTLNSLDYGNIYSVFREGILPVWEHPQNENGYSIVIYLNKSNSQDFIARIYQTSLLLLIGNNYSFSESLNGCTLERKTGGNKVVFWMATTPETNTERMETVKQIMICLGIARAETTFCDPNARIDWRDSKFSGFKAAVACKSHKVKANEQPTGPYPPQRPSQQQDDSAKSQRGRSQPSHQPHPSRGGGGGPSRDQNTHGRYTRK